MTKKNTLQLRRRPSKFSSYDDAVSAIAGADVAEGELVAGFYEENGEDHAVLGLGGVNGQTKAFFSDGQGEGNPEEIAKIKEAVGYYEESELVDLGLPSGTLWAKCNIGATKLSDFGKFFQWGDTQGYEDASEHRFTWDDYKWGTSWDNLTKYNDTDGLTTLEASDDSAVAATGGQASMPTKDQLEELINNTEHRRLCLANGVNGMKFWKKGTDEPTDSDSYIFIPAAGYCGDGSHDGVGPYCYVWSATRDESVAEGAWSMSFYVGDDDDCSVDMYYTDRWLGFSVRGVAMSHTISKPKSTKLDPVPDSIEGNLPVLTDKGTLSSSETVFIKEGKLIQVKDDKAYPVAHPDISTQASILSQRFGNMDIKEILIPIEPPIAAQSIDTESLPLSAMPVMASVFCNSAFAGATLEKGTESWNLIPSYGAASTWNTYNDWWLLVRYVDQDEPVYYGPTFDWQTVDLNLPSGTLWAKCNLGAEKETDFGLFFQWGDTRGYKDASEHQFTWNDYKWGTESSLTKYNSTDGKLVLDNEDDPMSAATNGKFKMPTNSQLEELIDNTNHEWVRLENGVNGMKFINKNDETKYIFIPAAGYCSYGNRFGVGSWGYVWSASRYESLASSAWYMYFDAGDIGMGSNARYLGYSVRGVVA